MTQPIDRETAIALAKEAGAYYAGSTNPGTVYMLSENDIERLCNLAASRTKMPELEPPIYGRELVLQLATDAGCPNGYLAGFALHHPEWDWIERLCNLAVAHSRKDAEPVAYTDASWLTQPSGTFVTKPHPSFKMALFTHPPEADKLLQQALEAVLDEHLPGFTEDAPRQHDDVIYDKAIEDAADAIQQLIARTYLENKA